jgi:hypothetical protein
MNWEALGAIGEIVGAVAVVLTIGYLAVQIRQNTAAMHMSAAEKALDNTAEFNRFLASDEQLGELWYRACEAPESLSEEEHRRFMNMASSLFRREEFVFFLHSEGHFPDNVWHSRAKLLRRWASAPGLQLYLRLAEDTVDDGFRRYLQDEIFPHADEHAEARRSWSRG